MSISCPGGTFPYVIVAGDTCYALAQRFGTTVTAIQAANPGLNCNNLQIGQTICIFIEPSTVTCPPGTQRYTIQPGDTFWSLAQRFNTTVQAIQTTNPGVEQPSGWTKDLHPDRSAVIHLPWRNPIHDSRRGYFLQHRYPV